jgi:uncharacterized protein
MSSDSNIEHQENSPKLSIRRRDAGQSHRLLELARPECLALLAAGDFGRVVVTTRLGHAPLIRPVNYRFDHASQAVVFRTGDGSKFHALAHSARVAFEIDAFEPQSHTAWSVIVSGVTEEITRPAEIRRLDELGLKTWAPGDRPHWIRIRARTVSGRRIEIDDESPGAAAQRHGSESDRQNREAEHNG